MCVFNFQVWTHSQIQMIIMITHALMNNSRLSFYIQSYMQKYISPFLHLDRGWETLNSPPATPSIDLRQINNVSLVNFNCVIKVKVLCCHRELSVCFLLWPVTGGLLVEHHRLRHDRNVRGQLRSVRNQLQGKLPQECETVF